MYAGYVVRRTNKTARRAEIILARKYNIREVDAMELPREGDK